MQVQPACLGVEVGGLVLFLPAAARPRSLGALHQVRHDRVVLGNACADALFQLDRSNVLHPDQQMQMDRPTAVVELRCGFFLVDPAPSLAILVLQAPKEVDHGLATGAILGREDVAFPWLPAITLALLVGSCQKALHGLCKHVCDVKGLCNGQLQLASQQLLRFVLHPFVVGETPPDVHGRPGKKRKKTWVK